MKKLLFIVLCVFGFLLSGCNFRKNYDIDYECSQNYGGATLRILNWGEYIDLDLVKQFEDLCNAKVIVDTTESNEGMLTKITTGDTDYDILVPSDYMIERLIAQDLVQKIDFNNVPNYQYIFEDLKGKEHDPNDEYSIPYFWGTVGLIYNKKKLQELGIKESELNTWTILKDRRLKGNLLLYDSQRDMYMIGFKLVDPNLSPNVEGDSEEAYEEYARNIDLATKQLEIVQENSTQYLTDTLKYMIANGDAAVGIAYNGDFLEVYYELGDEADNLGYVIPDEGSNMWFDSFVITKRSKNKRLAEEFLNFMNDPKVAYYNTIYVGYSTANAAAFELLKEDEDYEKIIKLEAYRPDHTVMEKLVVYRDLGIELNNKMSDAFQQLRAKSN